jgi:transcriptional regulator with XRE-family HTH domain
LNYARAIRTIRIKRGFTQAHLAWCVKVSPGYISLIEAGRRVPRMEMLLEFANMLGVPVFFIMLLATEPKDMYCVSIKDTESLQRQLTKHFLRKKPYRRKRR